MADHHRARSNFLEYLRRIVPKGQQALAMELYGQALDEAARAPRLSVPAFDRRAIAVHETGGTIPPRPAPTTIPSAGVPRQDRGRR